MGSHGTVDSGLDDDLDAVMQQELVAFLFYGLHPESGHPITNTADVVDMLNASGVVPVKQPYQKWNWVLTTDILNLSQSDTIRARERTTSGAREHSSGRILVSPVIYGTKFLHRLGGFFQWTDTNETGDFIRQPWSQKSLTYAFAAHRWLRLLTSTQEGRKFVSANGDRRGKLPISIVRAFFQEQPFATSKRLTSKHSIMETIGGAIGDLSGTTAESPVSTMAHRRFKRVLSLQACQQTLARELIPLLARMMNSGFLDDLANEEGKIKDSDGTEIDMTTVLHNLMMSPTKDYITRVLLLYLDYSRREACQKLSYVLSQSSHDLQRFAVTLLWELMRQNTINMSEFNEFGVRELKTLLHRNDDAAKGGIVEMAETILLEASYNRDYLEALILLGPPVEHICRRAEARGRSYMSSYGEQLVLRFLSMPSGLEFLLQSRRWLERTFDDWFNSRHIQYVQELDRSFMSAHHLHDDGLAERKGGKGGGGFGSGARRGGGGGARKNDGLSGAANGGAGGGDVAHSESGADESGDTSASVANSVGSDVREGGGAGKDTAARHGNSAANGSNDEAHHKMAAARRRQRGMAIPVHPPTWAESNDLLWLMRLPWRLVVECRVPSRLSDGSPESVTFLKVDSYIDVRPSAQRTRGMLQRRIQLRGNILGPNGLGDMRVSQNGNSRQRGSSSGASAIHAAIQKLSTHHQQRETRRTQSTVSASGLGPVPPSPKGEHRTTSTRRYTSASSGGFTGTQSMSDSTNCFDPGAATDGSGGGDGSHDSSFSESSRSAVMIPHDAVLTVWVCIGMHPVSCLGEVADPLPLVSATQQKNLHRPHLPPNRRLLMMMNKSSKTMVEYERALRKLTSTSTRWTCKVSASELADAHDRAMSNGDKRFSIAQKWTHWNFREAPRALSPKARASSNATGDGEGGLHASASTARALLLETIDVDLKLLPECAPRLPMPPHFYGEIGKTKAGADRLRKSGHIQMLEKRAVDDTECILYRRAAMIALGHVGASDTGFVALNSLTPSFVPYVLDLVRTSNHLSLRGTCFVVLGLIATSSLGRQWLADHGWHSPESTAAVSMPTSEVTHPIFEPIRRRGIDSSSDGEASLTATGETTAKGSGKRQKGTREGEHRTTGAGVPGLAATNTASTSQNVAELNEEESNIIELVMQLSNGIINATARKSLLGIKKAAASRERKLRRQRRRLQRKQRRRRGGSEEGISVDISEDEDAKECSKHAAPRGKDYTASTTDERTCSPFMDPHFFSHVLRTTLNAPGLTLASRQFVLFELFGELLSENGTSLLAEERDASTRAASPLSTFISAKGASPNVGL
eukprot:g5095.t1